METSGLLPTIFLSHGSPMLAVEDSPAGRFLDGLGGALSRPRAIVVASAHFMAAVPSVGAASHPGTIHDFGGFPEPLYQIRYPAPGDPELTTAIAGHLAEAGLGPALEPDHGLDHGVWVPLRRMYPQADIPVVALSVDPTLGASHHFEVGRALSGLRAQGVLVIGSGGFVHNLSDLQWGEKQAPMPDWATAFAGWMRGRLEARDLEALLDWERQAPDARRAHPTVEHLMPLFVALGAAGPVEEVRSLHRSHEFGSLALDAFAFH